VFPHIIGCAAVVVVMTPLSEIAGGVVQEIRYAVRLGKPVVPIALDGWRFLDETAWPVELACSGSLPDASFAERVGAHRRRYLRLVLIPGSLEWIAQRQFCGQFHGLKGEL
jgi:hypothetical protein